MVAGLTNDFDGAWHAVFSAQLDGEGIVLLRNGFILGCDDQYFYQGRYVLEDDGGFRTLVKVSHYAGDRAVSIFGEFGPFATLESFHVELRGSRTRTALCSSAGASWATPTGVSTSHYFDVNSALIRAKVRVPRRRRPAWFCDPVGSTSLSEQLDTEDT
jgi:T3SS negative regulator,GrlR